MEVYITALGEGKKDSDAAGFLSLLLLSPKFLAFVLEAEDGRSLSFPLLPKRTATGKQASYILKHAPSLRPSVRPSLPRSRLSRGERGAFPRAADQAAAAAAMRWGLVAI